jgi:hypothetical protein
MLIASGEVVSIVDESGKIFVATFDVTPSQISQIAPTFYDRLKERETVRVLIAHADEAGNMSRETLEVAEAFQPEIVFCCFPALARSNYPRMPIVGHTKRSVLLYYDREKEGNRVVLLKFPD